MGIAAEIYLDEEQDMETFERMVEECGHFEEKSMHEVLFAITFDGEKLRPESELQALGIGDLAILNGTPDDQPPERMSWREPLKVAEAADRLADHLKARDRKVAFVVNQVEERFGNADKDAGTMGLEFQPGEGGWALLEGEIRILAKIARWLAAEGAPRMTFVQNL